MNSPHPEPQAKCVSLFQSLYPPPPPQRMHYFSKAIFLNVRYLCCHGCKLHLCRWRWANDFFRPPSSRFPFALSIFIPIAVGVNTPMGTPRPHSNSGGSISSSSIGSGKSSSKRSSAPEEATAEAAAALATLVAAVAEVGVAAVQVQNYLHLCTKKSKDWLAV